MMEGILGKISKNTKVAIITHDTPDADAMASAYGMQWLLKKKYTATSDIFYGGEISHPENRAFVNVLSLSLKPIEDFYAAEKYDLIIIVDATENNVKLREGYKADIIIDHHRSKVKEEDYQYVLNKQAGSCSTLIHKIIESENLELTKTDPDINVATALLFGLIKDSNNLLSDDCITDDFDVYRKLSTNSDLSKVKEIQNYPLPEYFFQLSAMAIEENNYFENNGTYATFIGYLSEAKRDVLPYLADMLMRKDGISTTIVVAVVGDHIEASIRSNSVSLDVNEFSQKIFGKENAGGKRGAAGAKVALGFFTVKGVDEEYKKKIIDLVKEKILIKVQKEISND